MPQVVGTNGDDSLNTTDGLSNTGTISGLDVSATVDYLLSQSRIAWLA